MKARTKTAATIAAAALAGAVGTAIVVDGTAVKPLPDVAPIEVGEGHVLRQAKPLPPKESDDDGDGIQNTLDRCPWNAGTQKNGCPR